MPEMDGRLMAQASDRLQADSSCLRIAAGHQNAPATGRWPQSHTINRRQATGLKWQQPAVCQCLLATGGRPLLLTGDKRQDASTRR